MKASGIVVKGSQKGREYGFPTANIVNNKVPPGIYMAFATFGDNYHPAAVYVSEWRPELCEVHLLDWKGDLYGKEIEVEIGEKVRDDRKFDNDDDLKRQIKDDVAEIRRRCFQE